MGTTDIQDFFYPSPIGFLHIVTDSSAVHSVSITTARSTEMTHCCNPTKGGTPAADTLRWLDAYFRGDKKMPPLPLLHVEGTSFQQLVWNEIATIPRGSAITYGTLAMRLATLQGRRVMSAQAIGQAVKRNRHLILIPCHRVVAANSIGGYACGMHIKRWLLAHEGIKL